MADSIGDSVAEVLRRDKSRAWMLGQLRRAYPDRTDDELREAIDQVRRQRFAVAREAPEPPPVQPDRPPAKWHEPGHWPIWRERAELVAGLVASPAPTERVLFRAQVGLGWTRNQTIQVLAAAENYGLVEYVAETWQPKIDEETMTKPKAQKTKVIEVTRQLPCTLSDAERLAAMNRAGQARIEKQALELELQRLVREKRAEIAAKQSEIDRCLMLVSNGQEVRTVECEELHSYTTKRVKVVRLDTKATVEEREMRPDEAQLGIEMAAPASVPQAASA